MHRFRAVQHYMERLGYYITLQDRIVFGFRRFEKFIELTHRLTRPKERGKPLALPYSNDSKYPADFMQNLFHLDTVGYEGHSKL